MTFFPSKAAAQAFVDGLEADRLRLGADWADVPPGARAEIISAFQAAEKAGVSVRDAVTAAAAAMTASPTLTLGELAERTIAAKRGKQLRPRSLRALSGSIRRFIRGRERNPCAKVTPAQVEAYLAGLPISPRSRKGELINLATFFSHGVRVGAIDRNPCAAVERPLVEPAPTPVLTPDQAENMFRACEAHDPDLLGALALAAFAGFRPESEVCRMTRADVVKGLETGFLASPGVNKTRQRRTVPVVDNLRQWLSVWLPLGVEVIPINFDRRFRRLRTVAGLRPWPQNVLRHSRVSYRLAVTGDDAKTAAEDGHSQDQLHRSYKALVTPADGARYFAITPTPGANLAAAAAAVRQRQAKRSRGGSEAMRELSKARWNTNPSNQ